MKKLFYYSCVLGLGIVVGWRVFSTNVDTPRSGGSKPEQAENQTMAVYSNLLYSRVVADMGKNTLLLHRIDRGEVDAARAVLLICLRGDLDVVEFQTNHVWSKTEAILIERAKEYLSQNRTN